jgi:hypothetical protein
MKNTCILLSVAISLMILSISCNKDDDPDPSVNQSNVVNIDDDITEVSTWYADSVYIINDYNLYISNTLTIQAGTLIKFKNKSSAVYLESGGTIIANGTSDKPIIFTSIKDDAHGGDHNKDGVATQPSREDWGYISTNDENGSIFNYCEFYYGGNSSYSSTLEVYGNNIQVTHCTFAHNSGNDESGWYGALDATYGESDCQINNNVFWDNIRPFSVGLEFDIDNTNIFHNPDEAAVTNTYNGIFVETLNDLNSPISWAETEVAFVIDDNDWWINEGASLTLANQVVLKFRSGSAMVLDNGSSSIVNHAGAGVYFTSYKDDNYKGDTNGDGSTTGPSTGDWDGIYDNDNTSDLHWTNMLYESE